MSAPWVSGILKERRTESTKAIRFRYPHRHAKQPINSP
ncbi:hypothetical protein FHU35_1344 [Saccharopolyspora dendranthemae]|uniref:Uncharacterized protein n=1 Tax=Saccharopolyspora dendranthemae TaxID=1181886 RepID=A0A561U4S5_9PSEU|nr:hypothetical protein FHU35_1344 [Saccharopolyspora dendranthemae]